jgi:hypothetical protein
MRMMLLVCLILPLAALDIPEWVEEGILAVESSSYYGADGHLVWVNRTRGRDGELGAWQVTPIAWMDVRKKGERFKDLKLPDQTYSRTIFRRYITKMYRISGSWSLAVQYYNAGPGKRSPTYLRDVIAHARRLGYGIK